MEFTTLKDKIFIFEHSNTTKMYHMDNFTASLLFELTRHTYLGLLDLGSLESFSYTKLTTATGQTFLGYCMTPSSPYSYMYTYTNISKIISWRILRPVSLKRTLLNQNSQKGCASFHLYATAFIHKTKIYFICIFSYISTDKTGYSSYNFHFTAFKHKDLFLLKLFKHLH